MIMGVAWTVSIYLRGLVDWCCSPSCRSACAAMPRPASRTSPGGGDPGAPSNPNLKRKAITTTWVAAILTAVIWLVVRFSLVPIPSLPG